MPPAGSTGAPVRGRRTTPAAAAVDGLACGERPPHDHTPRPLPRRNAECGTVHAVETCSFSRNKVHGLFLARSVRVCSYRAVQCEVQYCTEQTTRALEASTASYAQVDEWLAQEMGSPSPKSWGRAVHLNKKKGACCGQWLRKEVLCPGGNAPRGTHPLSSMCYFNSTMAMCPF